MRRYLYKCLGYRERAVDRAEFVHLERIARLRFLHAAHGGYLVCPRHDGVDMAAGLQAQHSRGWRVMIYNVYMPSIIWWDPGKRIWDYDKSIIIYRHAFDKYECIHFLYHSCGRPSTTAPRQASAARSLAHRKALQRAPLHPTLPSRSVSSLSAGLGRPSSSAAIPLIY